MGIHNPFWVKNRLYVNGRLCCDVPDEWKMLFFQIDQSFLVPGVNVFSIRPTEPVPRANLREQTNLDCKDIRKLNVIALYTAILPRFFSGIRRLWYCPHRKKTPV